MLDVRHISIADRTAGATEQLLDPCQKRLLIMLCASARPLQASHGVSMCYSRQSLSRNDSSFTNDSSFSERTVQRCWHKRRLEYEPLQPSGIPKTVCGHICHETLPWETGRHLWPGT
jgi:hypothetical protein